MLLTQRTTLSAAEIIVFGEGGSSMTTVPVLGPLNTVVNTSDAKRVRGICHYHSREVECTHNLNVTEYNII